MVLDRRQNRRLPGQLHKHSQRLDSKRPGTRWPVPGTGNGMNRSKMSAPLLNGERGKYINNISAIKIFCFFKKRGAEGCGDGVL